MSALTLSILSALGISMLSLVGVIFLLLKKNLLNKILILLISFSAGGLLGGAFFHLLPEAIDKFNNSIQIFKYIIISICLFFILERVLRWRHCHNAKCEMHKHLGYLNLFGDGVHNFIDGLIIISAFSINPALGVTISISIVLHEIPQEISDFGVLIYSGFNKTKAILYNLFSALLSVLGVVVGFFLINHIENLNNFLLPFAAGGFIYIAASDLIPELHKEQNTKKSLISFIVFILALIFMWLLV